MYKSIENRKSKICTKPILSSTYIEESKKQKECISMYTEQNVHSTNGKTLVFSLN